MSRLFFPRYHNLAALAPAGAPASSLLTDLVAHWKLDEVGGTRNDSHGSSHLSEVGLPTGVVGKIGNAVSLNGSTMALSCADNADLSMGDVDFTVAAWVQLASTPVGDMYALGKGVIGAHTHEYLLGYAGSNGELRFMVADSLSSGSISASTFGPVSTSTWYFVVAWHDASADTINIQINDGTVDSDSYADGSFDSSDAFAIGRPGGTAGNYWNGLIDSVSVWRRVLTAGERTQLYNSGSGLDYGSF